ncbi:pilus assembly protein TadG-related protein [Streptomyces sp. NPDC003042]
MIGSRSADQGQAFPIYIVMVACLLFAALAFFAVGQASVTRSNGQGAADAAALAAARDARDHLVPGLDLVTLTPEGWEEVLAGNRFDGERGCSRAQDFAALNDAAATCTRARLQFRVAVVTTGTVGNSVIPGTGDVRGRAEATALIEPRCRLGAIPDDSSSATPTPGAMPSPGAGLDKPGPVTIECDDSDDVSFDPSKPKPWDRLARSLFKVRLVD